MQCIKCNSENFILESTILLEEKYKIYKNGRVADHPFKEIIAAADMTDNENIIRCTDCNTAYVLVGTVRQDILRKTDFNLVDLEKDAIIVDF